MHYAIIAAGQGSRLAQEGITLPKPLVRLGNENMITRLIRIFTLNGATAVSVIVNEGMPEVKEALEALAPGVPLNILVKSTSGSMESFHELSKFISDEQFCLTTVDTVFRPEEFARYIKAFSSDTDTDGYMAVTSYVDDEKPLYVATDSDYNITGFLDHPVPEIRYISGGIYALRRNSLEVLSDCIAAGMNRMRDFQRALVAAGMRLKAFPFEKIIDVDHAADIRHAALLAGVPETECN